jgi:type I restriction enzyme R subunit
MVVTQSRKHCVQYFFEINRQLKERGINYQSLVGFSGEVSYEGQKYTESGLNLTIGQEGDVPLGLKNPKYRLLVVANKFQTGFDEPLVQSMYVDKHLGGVQCVQTL